MTGSPSIAAITVLSLLILASIGTAPPASAALAPDHIAILANQNSPDSVAVAHHYAEKRGVPVEHVIQLDLPAKETISRQVYEQELVRPIRRALIARRIAPKVRVLVATYGIPLRVRAPIPTQDQQRWLKDAAERQRFAEAYLTRIEEWLSRIAAVNARLGGIHLTGNPADTASATSEALLTRVSEGIRAAARRLQQVRDHEQHEQWTKELSRITALVGGVAAVVQHLHASPTSDPGRARQEIEKLQHQIGTARGMIEILLQTPSDDTRQRAYRLAKEVFGLTGMLRLANVELETFSFMNGDASVDSELSLLWWDTNSYRLAGRLPNPLHYQAAAPGIAQGSSIPILMVSRLDAPTPRLARELVDQALEAEQRGLTGTVYVDARGMTPDGQLGYGAYDQSLRDLASLARHHSPYPVVLEDTERRFSNPGEAPDVAVYVGWYRLRAYEDAFTFMPGALGYHIASGEAVSLHNPNETGWCKNALERGITATLGSTGEPYVDAFPLPSEFVGLLLTGRYSLVEAYFLTTRYVSWRMVLIGDPLYNPWRGKGVVGEKGTVLQPLRGKEQIGLPRAPSEQGFRDPVLARQAAGKRREAALAQIDYFFKVQR